MAPESDTPASRPCDICSVKLKCLTCRKWFMKLDITVEPIILLICFSGSFCDSVTTNLIEERICALEFNYSSIMCSSPMNKMLEEQIQPQASRIIMAKTFIEALLPAVMSFFIGPWSDTNGRKPFLLASISGYVISYAMWGIFAYFKEIPATYFLLVTIPTSISGGNVALFTCVFCYISDVTIASNRGFRMVITQSSLLIGFLFGSLLVPIVYKEAGYNADSVIFLIACGCNSAVFFYTLLLLPETVKNSREIQKSFFDISHVKDMMSVVLQKRPSKGRAAILILVTICTVVVAIFQGDISVKYLSLREAFTWTLEEFNNFSALCSLISVTASLLGMWIFRRILHVHEIYIILIVSFLGLLSQILVACSTKSLSYKLSANIACLTILIGPLTRTELSKIVPKSDLGKVFGFLSSLEALTPLTASPLYTTVYNMVLKILPLAVFFLSAALWGICILLVIFLISMYLFYGGPYYSHDEFLDETTQSEEDTTIHINS